MKGDFTRGHKPDRKRGEKYRRVLLQQGRLVLDSDVAASVDAVDTLVRDLAADVGCPEGSPDYGYLVTPGPLFAFFDTLDLVTVSPDDKVFNGYRDYEVRYPEGQGLFPSLYIGATAEAGTVQIKGRRTLQANNSGAPDYYPTLRVWARIASGTNLDVNVGGVTLNPILGVDSTTFQAYDLDLGGQGVVSYSDIALSFSIAGASNEAWIGLIEGVQPAGKEPLFWITGGRYYLEGLEVELDHSGADGEYPDITFPQASGFDDPNVVLLTSQHVVAYVEGWERLVTHVEDKGILEQALGGALDTTVRTQAIGQVKLAYFNQADSGTGVDPVTDDAAILGAFAAVDLGTAQLDVTTTPTVDNPDPCAIPEAGGYTGPDNRLYRFEVHQGGDLGVATIKWSKNNGADLFAATIADAAAAAKGIVTLASGANVRDGDLVEVLVERDDLGDAAPAQIKLATPSFRPADRSVGVLYYAQTTSVSGQIQVLDLVTKLATALPAGIEILPGAKLRRWDGLLVTAPVATPVTSFDLGDGITVVLSGASFRPGDYWQYEARKLKDNANGAWQKSPHGPERLFAPLALLRWDDATSPLVLRQWYFHHFRPICELNADDISYDGNKAGTTANTVQEAIDELFLQIDVGEGGCCQATLVPGPPGADDGQRIQTAIATALPASGGVICLKPGVYTFLSTVTIAANKRVEIHGCPEAVIVSNVAAPSSAFDVSGELVLSNLVLFASTGGPLVTLPGTKPRRLTLREVGLAHVGKNAIAIQASGATSPASPVEPNNDITPINVNASDFPSISIEQSVLAAPWVIVADQVAALAIRDSVLVCNEGAIYGTLFDRLEIARSVLSAKFAAAGTASSLTAVAVANVGAALTSIAESLGSLPSVDAGSIGMLATIMRHVRIEDTTIEAWCCIRVAIATDLVSAGNRLAASGRAAARFDTVQQMTLSRNAISSSTIGLHVSHVSTGLLVENTDIVAAHAGIVLGADFQLKPVLHPRIFDVRVAGSHFEGLPAVAPASVGILVGPLPSPVGTDFSGVSPSHGGCDSLFLSNNAFLTNQPDVCIAVTLIDNQGTTYNPKVIIGNDIRGGRIGILASGLDLQIRDNVITSNAPSQSGVHQRGILLWETTNAVIESNRVELNDTTTKKAGDVVALAFAASKGSNVNARVAGNVVLVRSLNQTSATFDAVAGSPIQPSSRLKLLGNDFEGGPCTLNGHSETTMRDNRLACGVLLSACNSGIVSENHVDDLRITQCTGDWQIANNRSGQDVVLLPVTTKSSEVAYNAQVVGNWAKHDLAVGNVPPGQQAPGGYISASPADGSIVQVISNRADNLIIVNTYTHEVVSLNIAPSFLGVVPLQSAVHIGNYKH
jgi:Family of unknown function (DUF6519)